MYVLQIISCANEAMLSWELARKRKSPRPYDEQNCDITRWVPPTSGALKCNINASFSKGLKRNGFGMCLRGHNGSFVQTKSMWINQNLPVHAGEAMGLLFALQWVTDLDNNVLSTVTVKWSLMN